MKTNSIEKLLKGVCDKLIVSLPQNVKDVFSRAYITGGCIPSMLLGEYVKDYDVYFSSKEDADIISKYYKEMADIIPEHILCFTENAITLDNKIQLILKFTGSPDEVVKEFDWEHIKNYFLIGENKLVMVPDVYKLVLEKQLIYTGSKYPLSTLFRMQKYIKKGWHITNTDIIRIVFDIIKEFNYIIPTPVFNNNITSKEEHEDQSDYLNDIYTEALGKYSDTLSQLDESQPLVNVNTFIEQLNGVDPITIQQQLKNETGKYLTINQIINLINN